jgi:hypothetical protein
MKNRIEDEKSELAEVENKINQLQAKYQLKKIEIDGLKSKFDEKTKLVNEARSAYRKVTILIKIIENTTKLIEAVSLENDEDP